MFRHIGPKCIFVHNRSQLSTQNQSFQACIMKTNVYSTGQLNKQKLYHINPMQKKCIKISLTKTFIQSAFTWHTEGVVHLNRYTSCLHFQRSNWHVFHWYNHRYSWPQQHLHDPSIDMFIHKLLASFILLILFVKVNTYSNLMT